MARKWRRAGVMGPGGRQVSDRQKAVNTFTRGDVQVEIGDQAVWKTVYSTR